jgi:uncharacterized membrane protein YebE (DUF533 family)
MSAQSLLEQLLKSGMSALGGAGAAPGAPRPPRAASSDSHWEKYATGGAVGGALGLLLGSKRGRGIGVAADRGEGIAGLRHWLGGRPAG